MHIIKTRLWNRMGEKWMNDYSVTYIEEEIFNNIDNEAIIQRFQNMKTRLVNKKKSFMESNS